MVVVDIAEHPTEEGPRRTDAFGDVGSVFQDAAQGLFSILGGGAFVEEDTGQSPWRDAKGFGEVGDFRARPKRMGFSHRRSNASTA